MDDERARELLAAERARIEHALAGIAADKPDGEDVPNPFEATDVAQDMFDEEVDEAQAEVLKTRLDAIARAEERLVEGTYGVSVDSGEPIDEARLEAVPWAERTTEEQARYNG
jgi:DnaK suppressor protein